ncbi:MAG TPA: fumarylacetoacetate hydrolase family protein [Alphaproteobacteria bacterium]|nr:fumarylacetoacetate hydrolase family protein [Alphaproteobacteria bacterium]
MKVDLNAGRCLPADRDGAVLVGRAWAPGDIAGPCVIAVRGDDIVDLTPCYPTVSQLANQLDLERLKQEIAVASVLARRDEVLVNSDEDSRDPKRAWLLAPCDLQAVKASGVTFVASLLERVIEEQARGDAAKAEDVRRQIVAEIGNNLSNVAPGSAEAVAVKAVLVKRGMWSQYLEVGIGADAEVFTKMQPMSVVGHGARVGIHPRSTWNNPEPEIVLVVNAAGTIVGATLGNDVNLRDFEGRSALLLGRAKDNNASGSIGPFIRLFDQAFSLETVAKADLAMTVEGPDNYRLEATSSMSKISRPPADLVRQASGAYHQYPDGFVLYLGTMFAPVDDRDRPGEGFTHKVGDVVSIETPSLGRLANRVDHCDRVPPWEFGIGALMRNLAARNLLTSRN